MFSYLLLVLEIDNGCEWIVHSCISLLVAFAVVLAVAVAVADVFWNVAVDGAAPDLFYMDGFVDSAAFADAFVVVCYASNVL